MQHDHISKKSNFGLGLTSKSTHRGWIQAFRLKYHLICFKSITPLPAFKISVKILTTALVIAKLKYLTIDWGQSVGVEFKLLIYRHLVLMVYSEYL